MRYLLAIGLACLLPALGSAAENIPGDWSYDPLYDDWRLSQVMLGTVATRDGVYGGDVHDVIIGSTGLVKSVVVEWYVPEKMDRRFYEVDWADLDFAPRLGEVEVTLSAEQVEAMDKAESPEFAGAAEYEASNLIGMPVELDDRKPYGEVSDLLVSSHVNDLSAYVVKSDGPGLMEYALPAGEDAIEAIDRDRGILALPYVVEDVEELEVFLYDRANRLKDS